MSRNMSSEANRLNREKRGVDGIPDQRAEEIVICIMPYCLTLKRVIETGVVINKPFQFGGELVGAPKKQVLVAESVYCNREDRLVLAPGVLHHDGLPQKQLSEAAVLL